MKDNMWYQSAEIAEKVGNELSFEVTEGQKEYMESHMDEVDEKLESRFDEAPHTVRFEPFFNGVEDAFICECYFDKWYK